jgi:hypothetical protein
VENEDAVMYAEELKRHKCFNGDANRIKVYIEFSPKEE